jgi:hypothetical protein
MADLIVEQDDMTARASESEGARRLPVARERGERLTLSRLGTTCQ